MALRILDRKALRAKGVPYSNVHLLRLEAQGKFPQRFKLGENRVAWIEDDVDRWIAQRITSSRGTSTPQAEPATDRGGNATA